MITNPHGHCYTHFPITVIPNVQTPPKQQNTESVEIHCVDVAPSTTIKLNKPNIL